jgi:stage II sporulation protein D
MSFLKRTAPIALAAAALLAPAAADAAWKVDGRGFGHGVGLSQYGAYGYAEHGRSYREILHHYYVGTRLGRGAGGTVRVLLGSRNGSVGFRGSGAACGHRLNQRRRYSFAAGGGSVELRDSDGKRITGCGGEGKAGGGVLIDGFGRFRGELVAHANGGELLVINAVRLDDYVKGVVPNEMPSSWPQAALRAQAVVARSYGLATDQGGAFDQYSDTRSQVYGGKRSETRATNRAVDATKGEIVNYRGKVAVTYYFSTSGGQTEDARFGFTGGTAVPYLKSVKDPFDDISPVHRWTMRFSDEEMERELGGLFSGKLRKVEVVKTGKSPRIVRAKVVGSRGSSAVSGDTMRSRLGLRSTWARFTHR